MGDYQCCTPGTDLLEISLNFPFVPRRQTISPVPGPRIHAAQPVNRTRNFHNFSLETPEFFDDLFLRFTTMEPPQSRELYFLETPDGVRYFVLTRGR